MRRIRIEFYHRGPAFIKRQKLKMVVNHIKAKVASDAGLGEKMP